MLMTQILYTTISLSTARIDSSWPQAPATEVQVVPGNMGWWIKQPWNVLLQYEKQFAQAGRLWFNKSETNNHPCHYISSCDFRKKIWYFQYFYSSKCNKIHLFFLDFSWVMKVKVVATSAVCLTKRKTSFFNQENKDCILNNKTATS